MRASPRSRKAATASRHHQREQPRAGFSDAGEGVKTSGQVSVFGRSNGDVGALPPLRVEANGSASPADGSHSSGENFKDGAGNEVKSTEYSAGKPQDQRGGAVWGSYVRAGLRLAEHPLPGLPEPGHGYDRQFQHLAECLLEGQLRLGRSGGAALPNKVAIRWICWPNPAPCRWRPMGATGG